MSGSSWNFDWGSSRVLMDLGGPDGHRARWRTSQAHSARASGVPPRCRFHERPAASSFHGAGDLTSITVRVLRRLGGDVRPVRLVLRLGGGLTLDFRVDSRERQRRDRDRVGDEPEALLCSRTNAVV